MIEQQQTDLAHAPATDVAAAVHQGQSTNVTGITGTDHGTIETRKDNAPELENVNVKVEDSAPPVLQPDGANEPLGGVVEQPVIEAPPSITTNTQDDEHKDTSALLVAEAAAAAAAAFSAGVSNEEDADMTAAATAAALAVKTEDDDEAQAKKNEQRRKRYREKSVEEDDPMDDIDNNNVDNKPAKKSQNHEDQLANRRLKDRQRYANMTQDQRLVYNSKRCDQYHRQSEISRQRRRDRERSRYHSLDQTCAKDRNTRRAKLERERYQRLTPEELEANNRRRRERAASSRQKKADKARASGDVTVAATDAAIEGAAGDITAAPPTEPAPSAMEEEQAAPAVLDAAVAAAVEAVDKAAVVMI